MSIISNKSFAYNIKVKNTDGVTIYYDWVNYKDQKCLSVTRYNNPSYYGVVNIPESVEYEGNTYKVISISGGAFWGCNGVTSITIPETVISIGRESFYDCTKLVSITIPNSVTSIGSYSFYGCRELKEINLSSNLTKIEFGLFSYCTMLESVIIPNGVTSIEDGAFLNCKGLTSVTMPSNVTSIANSAFSGCTGLTSITIPKSVQSIGDNAFSGCSSLTSINYLCNPTSLGKYIFRNCDNVKEILFGSETIMPLFERTTYYENTSIEKITLTEDVKYIDKNAFAGWIGLTSINIPNSVMSIGDCAFSETAITSVDIPNSVTSIGSQAFSWCKGLTSLTIGNSVTSISDLVFYGCSSLTSVTIPNSVTSIGSQAFSNCKGLTSLTIGNSVTSIGDWAFYGCSSLTSVTIPNSVTSIGNSTFKECSGLTSVKIQCNLSSIGEDIFIGCNIEDATFDCETVLPFFKGKDSLKKITFASNVKNISSDSFSGCDSLTSITLPDNLSSIGSQAFSWCTGLTSITVPSSVTSLGYRAFENCRSLSSITIPSGLKEIGSEPFSQCGSVKEFNVTITDYSEFCKNIVLGKIKYFFMDNYNRYPSVKNITLLDRDGNEVKEFIIPDGVTSINDYAFYYCVGLTSVSIPNSVTSIGTCAFYNCNSLKSITIPPNVTSIEKGAFCAPLDTVISLIENPFKIYDLTPNVEYYNLRDEDYPVFWGAYGATLFVPKGTINRYKEAGGWDFKDIKELGTNDIFKLIYMVDGEEYKTYEVEYGAKITPEPTPTKEGYTFSGWSYIPSTMPAQDVTVYGTFSVDESEYAVRNGIKYKKISANECEVISGGSCSGDIVIPETITSYGKEYTVTSIGTKAFKGCRSLTSVSIPYSVTVIGSEAFRGCEYLTSVNIPNGVTYIGDWAFCATSITSITIPNGVTSLEESVFNGCDNLSSVTIPNSITSIGRKAFYRCLNLTSINIPNSITSIGELAFFECKSLTSVTIPNSVTSIGANAFDGEDEDCPNIQTIISLIENPFEIYGKSSYKSPNGKDYLGVFNPNIFNNATLYVPKGTIDKYKATNGWKDFSHIEENPNETGIRSLLFDNDIREIHSLNGEKLQSPSKGINILMKNDGSVKKVLVK